MNPIRICITGGHLTPALALVDRIKKRHPDWELFWIGRTVALEGSGVISEEPRLVQTAHIPFYSITAGRLNRFISLESMMSLFKIPVGFIQAFRILRKKQPDIICSFGGYVALPVAVSAYLLGIPVVTHEQAHYPGLANRVIAIIAAKIFVTHEGTRRFFPLQKTIHTGLPIRNGIFDPPTNPSFAVSRDACPLLYIMGGSTGAESMNRIVYQALPSLLSDYRVVHQVGALSLEKARMVKNGLNYHRSRYTPVAYLDIRDLAWVYAHSRLVIGRSGANTVGELLALGKRTICIPLPWGGKNEQEENARELVEAGMGVICPQSELTPETLVSSIRKEVQIAIRKKSSSSRMQKDASESMVDTLEALL